MVAYNLFKIIPVPSEHKLLVLNGSVVNEKVKISFLSCPLLCIRGDMILVKILFDF